MSVLRGNWDVHCRLNANNFILPPLTPWCASWAQNSKCEAEVQKLDGRYFRKGESAEHQKTAVKDTGAVLFSA